MKKQLFIVCVVGSSWLGFAQSETKSKPSNPPVVSRPQPAQLGKEAPRPVQNADLLPLTPRSVSQMVKQFLKQSEASSHSPG